MKAAVFEGPGQIAVQEVPDPVIQNPDEAIVTVTYCCIGDSDLWLYRSLERPEKTRKDVDLLEPCEPLCRAPRKSFRSNRQSRGPNHAF